MAQQRLQGWLQVADKAALELERSVATRKRYKLGRRRPKSREPEVSTVWRPYFCILQAFERSLHHSITERRGSQTRGRTLHDLRLRLERGRRINFQSDGLSTPSPVTEEEDSELSETASLRDDRLLLRSVASSVPSILQTPPTPGTSSDYPPKRHTIGFAVIPDVENNTQAGSSHELSPVGTPSKTMDTPSRLANFFSKRSLRNVTLKRTKSVTKLERKRCALDSDVISPSQLRGSRSHESLLQSSPSILGTVDLSTDDIQVSSVHNSLLDQNFCFQLTSKDGTTYYSCQTNQERDKWIQNLQQTIHPNRDQQRRTEKSLNLWLLEAKGISSKKKYFCELCLDKTLYARTSSKLKNDLCFWGERFEFNNLPHVESITVNLYREADKKKRRDKNILIGSTVIQISSLSNHHLTEKWYPIFVEKYTGGKDTPSLRIKTRFLNLSILPFDVYSDFLQYLKADYKTMCEILEPAISVRTKEDIATSLIYIMEKECIAKRFLTDIVMSEIDKIEDHRLMLRGNSTATKAIEAYMKLIGEKYLQDTLGEVVKSLMASTEDCEVDPVKVTGSSQLLQHQTTLMAHVELVWNRITASASFFPVELREIFSECRQRLEENGKEEALCDNLISASVFLRFLCPAILSPSLFNLSHEYPQGKTARKLTLIAKSIQTFANFTRFGGKESFMEFMNEFLEREWTSMKTFLKEISSPIMSLPQPMAEFDGHIDEGREFALLHNLLVDSTSKIADKSSTELEKLQSVLDGISAALSQPPLHRQMSSPVPPSPTISGRLTSASLPETSAMASITNTYLMGSTQPPANDLNSTGDYVLLAALETDPKPPLHGFDNLGHSDEGLPFIEQKHTNIRPLLSAAQQASRLHAARRSFNVPSKFSPKYTTDLKHQKRQLWDHNEVSNENSNVKPTRFSSLPHQSVSTYHSGKEPGESPSGSMSGKSLTESPRLAPPLAFNNPLYQPRYSERPSKRQNSPLSSFSSESDDDIAIIGRTCVGNTGSEPVLVPGSKYCCTSSSSTDTNSCGSPPQLRHHQIKSGTHLNEGYRMLKQFDQHSQTQPCRSSSDTIGFDQTSQLVHRSSTDSGLHKSFRSSLKTSHYIDNLKCATQNRKIESRWWKMFPESVEEYEEQVRALRSSMKQLQKKLQDAEVKLNSQENKTENVISEWSKRMDYEEATLRKHQEEKDQQMKSIIARLTKVEDELQKDQREMQTVIVDQQKIIEAQDKKIRTLDATNTHLLAVLSHFRGHYSWHGRNGSTPPFKTNFVPHDSLFKSSSC